MKKSEMKHKIGDDIYIDSALYLSHGSDDFCGGLCRITHITMEVSGGKKTPFIKVAERPGYSYNYEELLSDQKELKKTFGKNRGHSDPDVDTPWIEPGDFVVDENGPHIADYNEW